ncbi:MAG: hypothetical protein COB09_17035 [Thalassobium sp.]|nr:MAG: hypothetical protein COB09_17035 [Thalassobium sp.]
MKADTNQALFGGVESTEMKVPPVARLLRIYSDRGKTLEWCCNPKIIKLKMSTLKKHCRKFNISFPDYTPRAMKEKP